METDGWGGRFRSPDSLFTKKQPCARGSLSKSSSCPLVQVARKSRFGHEAAWRTSRASEPRAANVTDFFKARRSDLKDMQDELREEEAALRRSVHATWRSDLASPIRSDFSKSRGKWTRQQGPERSDSQSLHLPPLPQAACPEGALSYQKMWDTHDQAWELFTLQPPAQISLESVPWPPCNGDVLEFADREARDLRRAYLIACRRWHPDKFLQQYGSRVPPDILPELTSRLNEVFQAVTAQWNRSQVAQAAHDDLLK